MEEYKATILLVVLSVGLVALVYFRSRLEKGAFAAVASGTGLTSTGRGLEGIYNGYRVKVYTSKRPSGGPREVFTVAATPLDEEVFPPGIELRTETLGVMVRKATIVSDTTIGDRALDDAFLIQTSEPEDARAFLTKPSVRRALVQCRQRVPLMTVADGQLRVEMKGNATTSRELIDLLDAMTECAHALRQPTLSKRAA